MVINKELRYTLNYKPFIGLNKDIKNNNLIYCKNFFLFFLIIDNFLTTSSKKNYKLRIFKRKNYSASLLRAPNKYKKAQIKIALIRYFIIFNCYKYYQLPKINMNCDFLFNFVNFLFNFVNFFESTLFTLKRKKISIKLDPKYYLNLFEL